MKIVDGFAPENLEIVRRDRFQAGGSYPHSGGPSRFLETGPDLPWNTAHYGVVFWNTAHNCMVFG